MNQKLLNEYFASVWKPSTSGFGETGFNLANEVKDDEWVLDVGCGYNPFKQYLGDRLYAFDPAIAYGNELCSLEDFNSAGNQWDVVLCMGSINFGDEDHIASQIEKVVSLTKKGGRIYWRQNPGEADHDNEECKPVPFFEWNKEHNYAFAARFGCQVVDYDIDMHKLQWDKIRLYAKWTKN